MPFKIALLFLTDTDPHFPDIWDFYIASAGSERVNVYIHPKRPDDVKWRQNAIISILQPTEWGHITRAYRALLAEALTDPHNQKFIFLSESCVPIKPFDQLYAEMHEHPNESWIKRMPITTYDRRARLSTVPGIENIIGRANMLKHYSRTCLSRAHARKVVSSPRVVLVDAVHAGDEFFLSGIQPISARTMRDAAITEDDWDATNTETEKLREKIADARLAKNKDAEEKLWVKFDKVSAHPRTIHKLTKRDKARILSSKSFFYRKFACDSNIGLFIAEETLIS
jgi:hypothetical protein